VVDLYHLAKVSLTFFRGFDRQTRPAYSQFEDGQCCHAVPVILPLELILDVLVQERKVVRVVSVYALDERVDMLWPCRRVVARHDDADDEGRW
jgi:hypothetical protein